MNFSETMKQFRDQLNSLEFPDSLSSLIKLISLATCAKLRVVTFGVSDMIASNFSLRKS